eukprot:4593221-Lingulodinium_polyedra.AAC.1
MPRKQGWARCRGRSAQVWSRLLAAQPAPHRSGLACCTTCGWVRTGSFESPSRSWASWQAALAA